jgi:acyl-coenzyme A thioesterase PaaI-like protein
VDPAVTAELVRHGFTPWMLDGAWRHTSVQLGPEVCLPGTDRPSIGALAACVDAVSGLPPSGLMNPTIDLQVRLLGAPRAGTIHLAGRTLRLGRTLFVGEVELRHGPGEPPFGTGMATFLNQRIPFPERMAREAPVVPHTWLGGARRRAPGVVEVEAELDTPQGTVPGATLALLCERAVNDLAGDVVVEELDVRFLHKVKVGPVRATATVVGDRGDATTVRVEVVDAGDGDRLVTYAVAVCRPLTR